MNYRASVSARSPIVVACALAAMALVSCGNDRPLAEYPAAVCGASPYSWLPREGMGKVVRSVEDVLSPVSADDLQAILGQTSYTVPASLLPLPYGSKVYRVRYTTQDRGKPVEATGLVGVPWNAEGVSGKLPVVLLLHGRTGFTSACAPSRSDIGYLALTYAISALGYIVATPDYIGLDAERDPQQPPAVRNAFLNIEQTGIGSLDMVRAARALLRTLPQPTPLATSEVVLWGGSQGGHAAFASDLMAPYYAPELDIRGSVAAVPPTDFLRISQYAANHENPATSALGVFMVTQHYWFGGQQPFADILRADGLKPPSDEVPQWIYSGCDADNRIGDIGGPDDIYDPGFLAELRAGNWEKIEPWSCYGREGSISHTSIVKLNQTPTLFILGEKDTLVYTPIERDDFDQLCKMGYQLQYLECADAGHTDAIAWSLEEQLSWLRARLAGEPLDTTSLCQRTSPVHCAGQPIAD